MSKTVCVIPLVMLLLHCSGAFPVNVTENKDDGKAETQERSFYMKYLEQYGYLESSTKGKMRVNQTEITDALKLFQKMAGIPITGLLDAATNETMALPRCGVPDIIRQGSHSREKRYVLIGTKWEKKANLTYRFTKRPPSELIEMAELDVREAFDMWSAYIPSLPFVKKDDGLVDIELFFAKLNHSDPFPFDGKFGVLAHAFQPPYGDVHFDAAEEWTSESSRGINFLSTALHEIGHALGLGHSGIQDATMYAIYRGYKPNLTLHSDDIQGIQALYGGGNSALSSGNDGSPFDLYDLCRNTHVDAITKTKDGNIYVFRGENYFRLEEVEGGKLSSSEGPRPISEWSTLSGPIDSAITLRNGSTYLFKGEYFSEFSNQKHVRGPTAISDGFPGAPANIDAAFIGSGDNIVHFIKGRKVWRFSGTNMDPVDQKALSEWTDLSSNIDAALTLKFTDLASSETYFFSAETYYRLNDLNDVVDKTREDWFGCKSKDESYKDDGGPQQLQAVSDLLETSLLGGTGITAVNMNVLILMLWCGLAIIHLL